MGDFLAIYCLIIICAEVVATISRSARQCVLRLSEDKISFVSLESGVLGGVNLWCELSQVRSLYNISYIR